MSDGENLVGKVGNYIIAIGVARLANSSEWFVFCRKYCQFHCLPTVVTSPSSDRSRV